MVIGETHVKGDRGEMKVIMDCLERGYKVSIPFGHNHRYDLIVDRNGELNRIQVKYTESDGKCIRVNARSDNGKHRHIYTSEDVEWLAVYDKTTDQIYYVSGQFLNDKCGGFSLRLTETKNNQTKGVNWAKDFTQF